ncbi:MAG: hypothetical protein II007_12370 [Gammaproteobacteria bacterium]|nr:hypothetical protein [Gammaproteobacteria bacterium]
MIPTRLSNSVGSGGRNLPQDVLLARALLNVAARHRGGNLLTMAPAADDALVQRIHQYQHDSVGLTDSDGRIDSDGATLAALLKTLGDSRTRQEPGEPDEGLVTWEAEGQEGGPFHSRILHVPSSGSGLTIGRGYDMKHRTAVQISSELSAAGVPSSIAQRLASAAGLGGPTAQRFVISADLLDFEITPAAQLKLFAVVYQWHAQDVQRISAQPAVVSRYGKLHWANIHPLIRQLLVDLRYRGDYTPESRAFLQRPAVQNDLPTFSALVHDLARWRNVPRDRFERRCKLLDSGH